VSASPTYLNVDLSAFAIPVAVGDQLAIVLRSFGTFGEDYQWLGDGTCVPCGDPTYARGGLFFRPADTAAWRSEPGDSGFRTFVRPDGVAPTPEPSTLLLLGAGFVYARLRRSPSASLRRVGDGRTT
jgi:hypothetical protein